MGNLFEELKRRKVFRVATLYLVGSWALIQVADTIAPMMNLPDSAPSLVLFILIIFFPLALFLAWAYEITPDGSKDANLKSASTEQARTGLQTGGLLALVALLPLAAGIYYYNGPQEAPASETNLVVDAVSDAVSNIEKSIAVLPFSAFSDESADRFFADGLSDTLLNKLAQLSDIRVVSRSSSFRFRGDTVDIRTVGEELGVATALEGSVQRSGDNLRIIAQLVNTNDGSQIFSRTFDRNGEDIFAIQDEIAEAVVDNLQLSLSPTEQQRLQETGTQSVEAYNLLTFISESAEADNKFELSDEEFKLDQYFWINEVDRVLEIDPNYAEAYRFIAGRYSELLFQSQNPKDDEYFLRKGFEAMNQAMILEPDNPINFAAVASLHRRAGRHDTAEAFARMALLELPNDPMAVSQLQLSLVAQNKNPAEALELVQYEALLNPGQSNQYRRMWFALVRLNRAEEAVRIIQAQFDDTANPQLAAEDLVAVNSNVLGRHVETMQSLIRVRDSLGDQAGDRLGFAWFGVASALGLDEEIQKIVSTIESPDFRASFITELAELRAYEAGLDYRNAALLINIALRCLSLQDYTCAVDNLIAAAPSLESREGKTAGLSVVNVFQPGLYLAHAFQKMGEPEAATRLIATLAGWYESRQIDGYMYSVNYALAELALLKGDIPAALKLIREGVMLEGDSFVPQCRLCSFESSLYESVQDNPEFQQLVAEFERRKAVNAEAVRALIAEAGY